MAKIIFICLIILTISCCCLTQRIDKTIELVPFYIGKSISLQVDHKKMADPNMYLFETNLYIEDIIELLNNSTDVIEIEQFGQEDRNKYLIMIKCNGGICYQELYCMNHIKGDETMNSLFLFYDGNASFVDEAGNLYGSIMFPTVILDSQYIDLKGNGGISIVEGKKYNLRTNIKSGKIVDFLEKYYNCSALYNVVEKWETGFVVKLDSEAININQVTYDEYKARHIFDEGFVINVNLEANTIDIVSVHLI